MAKISAVGALEKISELCDGDDDCYEIVIKVQGIADAAIRSARRQRKERP